MNSDRFSYIKKNPEDLYSRRRHKKFIDQEFSRLIREQGFFLVSVEDDEKIADKSTFQQKGVFRYYNQ
jgi:hypothetical protein